LIHTLQNRDVGRIDADAIKIGCKEVAKRGQQKKVDSGRAAEGWQQSKGTVEKKGSRG
jgi:hypothetical protein